MRDALGTVQSVLVLGGTSEIALATVRRLISARCRTVVLAVRDPEAAAPTVEELRAAGAATVEAVAFDALDDPFSRQHDPVHQRPGLLVVGPTAVVRGEVGLLLLAADGEAAGRGPVEPVRVVVRAHPQLTEVIAVG